MADNPEIAKPLLVPSGHHDVVSLACTTNQVRTLDGRPGRPATDHAAAGQDGFDLALGARAHVGVNQPPLPAAPEPDAPSGLERGDESFGVGLRSIPGMQAR